MQKYFCQFFYSKDTPYTQFDSVVIQTLNF